MALQPPTPPSIRHRWQGTRTSFVDLVGSLARCIDTGLEQITFIVDFGGHAGTLASLDVLRNELTEALWLDSRRIQVTFFLSDSDPARMNLFLEPERVLYVHYYQGTPQSRETLRNMEERELPPERPDLRRHWRWAGPLIGCAYYGTLALVTSRLPYWHTGWRPSASLRHALSVLGAITPVIGAVWLVVGTWAIFGRWFPPLERLPDTGQSKWDRRRGWVQFAAAVWVTLAIGLLAVPPSHEPKQRTTTHGHAATHYPAARCVLGLRFGWCDAA